MNENNKEDLLEKFEKMLEEGKDISDPDIFGEDFAFYDLESFIEDSEKEEKEEKEEENEDEEETPPPLPKEINCDHENKRKAWFGLIRYWYCPDCKNDVGEIKD